MNKHAAYLMSLILWLFSTNAYGQKPLVFVQITNTPDQVIGAEILKVAYQRLGMPIEIVPMPGSRALYESSHGNVDGEIHRIMSVERDYPTLIRVPTAINYIEPAVFSKKVDFRVTTCGDLNGYSIGIVRGVRHAEACTQGMQNVHLVKNSEQLMQLLESDRLAFAITAKLNGLVQLHKMHLTSIVALEPPLSKMPVYHYLHQKHADLVPKIDQVFKAMEKTHELERIRKTVIDSMLMLRNDQRPKATQ